MNLLEALMGEDRRPLGPLEERLDAEIKETVDALQMGQKKLADLLDAKAAYASMTWYERELFKKKQFNHIGGLLAYLEMKKYMDSGPKSPIQSPPDGVNTVGVSTSPQKASA
ncbi:MAG: hypothetical protein AMXMBFR84_26350 [Candidatus Hydrogenedentota bacterium]